MNLLELSALYLLAGGGAAVALLLRAPRRVGDALLVFALWPLYGPFVLARLGEGRGAAATGDDLAEALRRAAGSPLGALLPDRADAAALADRLALAQARIDEIDALLARPEFCAEGAAARLSSLRERGASEAAISSTGLRLQNIRRLQALRSRFGRELDEVRELLTQLATQAEVVRLIGATEPPAEELVRELLSRVEGLEHMLGDEPESEAPAPAAAEKSACRDYPGPASR